MSRASLAGWTIAAGFLVLAFVSGRIAVRNGAELLPDPEEAPRAYTVVRSAPAAAFLYGRVTTTGGEVHEGRLRFGGDEEALWTHYFNGVKAANPWADVAPASALVRERARRIVGIDFGSARRTIDLERPFMVRFGDVARIDASRRVLTVTLRTGDVVTLDRFEADDFADGLRIWTDGGVMDLDEWAIRSVEFLPTPDGMTGPALLRGTVHTAEGAFSGRLQWNREASLTSDVLEGLDEAGDAVSIPFGALASLEPRANHAVQARLTSGEWVVMRDLAGPVPHRGIYVDDERYGRVLVAWDAVEQVDLVGPDAGPAGDGEGGFDGFTGGAPLTGAVVTREGERVVGRIVFDLDESRSIETLDAPRAGVDYTLPFDRVASIEPAVDAADGVRVTLASGEVLELEAAGDLGPENAGVLVFEADGPEPDAPPLFVAWMDVARIDFEGTGQGR